MFHHSIWAGILVYIAGCLHRPRNIVDMYIRHHVGDRGGGNPIEGITCLKNCITNWLNSHRHHNLLDPLQCPSQGTLQFCHSSRVQYLAWSLLHFSPGTPRSSEPGPCLNYLSSSFFPLMTESLPCPAGSFVSVVSKIPSRGRPW